MAQVVDISVYAQTDQSLELFPSGLTSALPGCPLQRTAADHALWERSQPSAWVAFTQEDRGVGCAVEAEGSHLKDGACWGGATCSVHFNRNIKLFEDFISLSITLCHFTFPRL
jgi:hypothetical protein